MLGFDIVRAMPFLWILGATLVVSTVSMVGLLLFVFKRDLNNITFYLISLASGTLLGGAFLHLIPEALEIAEDRVFPLMAGGVFLFFIFEKFLIWRHCHHHHHNRPHYTLRPNTAVMTLAADAAHNFIDGIIIASSFLTSPQLGVTVTLAILLHEIPQELGDCAVMLHAGFPLKKVVIANGLTALMSVVGAVLTYFFLSAVPLIQPALLSVTAGGFLYIALADLIPQLHEQVAPRQTFIQISLLAGGFLAMWLLKSATH